MRVFIHTMYFLPEFGSAPILMNELAAFLSARGHEVHVVTTIPRPPHSRKYKGRLKAVESRNGFMVTRFLTNFTVHHIGRLVAWSVYTLMTILNLGRVRKGDVLFLRLPPLQLGVTGIIAGKLRKAKVILNVQDIHPDLSIESGLLRNPRIIRMALRFEKWIYDGVPRILVISEGFKKNLVDKGVDEAKIKILPNWVDTDFLKPLDRDNPWARGHGLDGRFVVMYSGTISISSIRTLETILDSARLLADDPEVLFVIVGEGLKRKELLDKARCLQLDNVLFLPFQPYADLPSLLASSDVLLVPLDKEKSLLSVPSKLYNFMAAGRPIMGLAHSDSEVRALIEQTGCGVCLSPQDTEGIVSAVRRLKRADGDRLSMGKNARRYAEANYSLKHVLSQMESLLLSLDGEIGRSAVQSNRGGFDELVR